MVDSAGFVHARGAVGGCQTSPGVAADPGRIGTMPGGGWHRPTCASRGEGWRSQPEIVESII
jgi:hypothetical protein